MRQSLITGLTFLLELAWCLILLLAREPVGIWWHFSWATFDIIFDPAAALFVDSDAEAEAANERTLSCTPFSINSLMGLVINCFLLFLQGDGERDEISEVIPPTTICALKNSDVLSLMVL